MNHAALLLFSLGGLGSALASCAAPAHAADTPIDVVEQFRAARRAGRDAEARQYLSGDPRIWYDERAGEGSPWTLGGGRWKAWDDHFRGSAERATDWQSEGDSVWADFFEVNEYFELTERGGSSWRGTYYFDESGMIAGFMVSGVPGVTPARGRRDEFEAWAREHRPGEAEYLMPGGSIDPTGDRAPRMRALLEEWRGTVGLPPTD